MNIIPTRSTPIVTMTRSISEQTPEMSMHVVDFTLQADHEGLEHSALNQEVFAKARVIMFDPYTGNPTDEADAHSQTLLDVASAFYTPDGDLSHRALIHLRDHEIGVTPCLAYVDEIKVLEGYENGGWLEAGLAIALKQLGKDFNGESTDTDLMVTAFLNNTLSLVSGNDVASSIAPTRFAPLTPELQRVMGLTNWVEPGQTFASEPGHGASAGLVLSADVSAQMGYGQTLKGNVLLGSPGFDANLDFDQVEWDREMREQWEEARLMHWSSSEEANHLLDMPDTISLVQTINDLKERIKMEAEAHILKPEDIEHLRLQAQELLSALPVPPTLQALGAKIRNKGVSIAGASNLNQPENVLRSSAKLGWQKRNS